MSKHGDAETTRKNRRSRGTSSIRDGSGRSTMRSRTRCRPTRLNDRIGEIPEKVPPRKDHVALIEEMITGFHQDDGAVDTGTAPPIDANTPTRPIAFRLSL